MKTQLKKLSRLSKIDCLNPENYYDIAFNDCDIKFQGHFNSKLVKKLTKLFGKGETQDNGYVYFSKSNIEIVLT